MPCHASVVVFLAVFAGDELPTFNVLCLLKPSSRFMLVKKQSCPFVEVSILAFRIVAFRCRGHFEAFAASTIRLGLRRILDAVCGKF